MMARIAFLLGLLAVATPASAQIEVGLTFNAASSRTLRMPRGGALAAVFCKGLRGKPGLLTAQAKPFLPFLLGSDDVPAIGVFVNGTLAPIVSIYIPPDEESPYARITFQVPFERNVTRLNRDGWDYPLAGVWQVGSSGAEVILFPSESTTFGAFFSDDKGYVMAEHTADHSPVTPENPARPGETITAYASDFFSVWPPPPIGVSSPARASLLRRGSPRGSERVRLSLPVYRGGAGRGR
jgi:uncharacterized protein (TIGR03437 family)